MTVQISIIFYFVVVVVVCGGGGVDEQVKETVILNLSRKFILPIGVVATKA